MNTAFIRFYEELNDFLSEEKKKQRFAYSFWGTPSVKDADEAIGVPHSEIDLILVNGVSVDFSFRIKNNDNISVYPVFESFDISDAQHLRPEPLRNPLFICDVHLGRLARYLRMTGSDVLYKKDFTNKDLLELSLKEKRAILTRDTNLLKKKEITHGYYIRNEDSIEQLKEIIGRFHLERKLQPFTRCMECNSLLEDVNKKEIENEIPEKVKQWNEEYKRCPSCRRIYWKGSHYKKMMQIIQKI